MTDFGGDRRSFFRRALGNAMEQVAKATEERIVQKRYVRLPGALGSERPGRSGTRSEAMRRRS